MSEYLIQDTTLTNIADAIKNKTGNSNSITVSNMANEINNISTKSDLSFITAGADQILSGYVGSDIEGNPITGIKVPSKIIKTTLNALNTTLNDASSKVGFSLNIPSDENYDLVIISAAIYAPRYWVTDSGNKMYFTNILNYALFIDTNSGNISGTYSKDTTNSMSNGGGYTEYIDEITYVNYTYNNNKFTFSDTSITGGKNGNMQISKSQVYLIKL